MTVFSDKLDGIHETIERCFGTDHRELAGMLAYCAALPTYSVGSGGSAVVAEFLAQCRAHLGHALTSTVTPLEYVLAQPAPGSAAWFFSASGDNHDIRAAFESGLHATPRNLLVVTNAEMGGLVRDARSHVAQCFVSPVADAKDGFLATHSAISTTLSLTIAADLIAGRTVDDARREQLCAAIWNQIAPDARAALHARLSSMRNTDTLLILHDPQLAAAATLVETSAWEAGLCAVQKADFRNFAHGRHVWIAKHASRTFVLALTTDRTLVAWRAIDALLPTSVARAEENFGSGGRASQLCAVAFGLAVVDVLGEQRDIDPGKPGVADFGRRIFDDGSLHTIVAEDEAGVRRKRRAAARVDISRTSAQLRAAREAFLRRISEDLFGGVVLDYDGTVVSTEYRFDPPNMTIVEELCRLLDNGLQVAFATGRGGSIGEKLRDCLPETYFERVLVGYYNGGWIVPLSVDLEKEPPPANAAIAEAHRRLSSLAGMFRDDWKPKEAPLQLTIQKSKLQNQEQGVLWLREAVNGLAVRTMQSGHSVDIFPDTVSKRNVVKAIRAKLLVPGTEILCIGDRGEPLGNDHELLEGPHGVSVGVVCDRLETGWNLAPEGFQGPDGLLSLLQALHVEQPGAAKMNVPISFTFG